MTLSVTNEGEVKMNSSSPTCSSSLRSASKAKIENVDAAMRTFEPGVISLLRSSPSSVVEVVDDLHWSTSVPGVVVGTRPADPGVDLGHLELPEPADPMGGHVLLGDPGVDAVLGDAKVLGDHVSRHPRLGHVSRLARCSPVFAGFTGSEAPGVALLAGDDPWSAWSGATSCSSRLTAER